MNGLGLGLELGSIMNGLGFMNICGATVEDAPHPHPRAPVPVGPHGPRPLRPRGLGGGLGPPPSTPSVAFDGGGDQDPSQTGHEGPERKRREVSAVTADGVGISALGGGLKPGGGGGELKRARLGWLGGVCV